MKLFVEVDSRSQWGENLNENIESVYKKIHCWIFHWDAKTLVIEASGN